jgi:hypothetical protein
LYIVDGLTTTCSSPGLAYVRTPITEGWTNDGIWYCVTYNGISNYKAKYYGAGIVSGSYPLVDRIGGSSASCNLLDCT